MRHLVDVKPLYMRSDLSLTDLPSDQRINMPGVMVPESSMAQWNP